MNNMNHPAVLPRPKVIQYTDPADRRLLRQSILGGDATSRFGVPMSVHYPLSGGVGVISNAQFRIVREATDGDIAMALTNSALKYPPEPPFNRPPKEK